MQFKSVQSSIFPNIHYRILGKGNTLVLLHGFPETGDLWKDVWAGLSEKYRLIIPDLPGAGKSASSAEPLTMELIAEAVKLILDAEGTESAVIAGHSMGGYAALAFAELYPAYMKGLIMVHSMASADTDEKIEQRKKSIALIQKGGKDTFIRQMIPNLYSDIYKKKNNDRLLNDIESALKQSGEGLVDFYNAMIKRPDRVNLLSGAVFPVQWLIGKQDNIATPEKVLQQTTLASVNFVEVYADCAHMGMIEQPGWMIYDISGFCNYCYRNL